MRRFRFGDFFSSMWLELARRPRSLPPAVFRNRFLVPEWVFILGIGRLLKQTPGAAHGSEKRLGKHFVTSPRRPPGSVAAVSMPNRGIPVKPWLSHWRRTPTVELRRVSASLTGLARSYRRWFVERTRRVKEGADPVSVFGQDPDDGPENEGLMRYGS
jgi:hypothetical protein